MKKPNHYKEAINLLFELKKSYPNQTLGQHLHLALEEYDTWNTSDKEIVFALEKYASSKEMDHSATTVDQIIQDGIKLNSSFLYEDENSDEDEF